MKFASDRPYADLELVLVIANSIDAVQHGRIHIEKINWPFLLDLRVTSAEYKAGPGLTSSSGAAGSGFTRAAPT
jgi:hypothetical protein